MIAHTQTPWLVSGDSSAGRMGIVDSDGFSIAAVEFQHTDDLRYAVRAVNSHADLLEALDRFIRAFEAHAKDWQAQAFCGIVASAKEAIAKAEGGEA